MPAARHASRLLARTLAVTAMIGGWPPGRRARMRRVASNPSMSGNWQSISTTSQCPWVAKAMARSPFSATSKVSPSRRK